MTEEDEEFNRIEREAAMRKAAVRATTERKQWVGLTEDEKVEIRREHYARTLPLMEAVEAKLKEKNT